MIRVARGGTANTTRLSSNAPTREGVSDSFSPWATSASRLPSAGRLQLKHAVSLVMPRPSRCRAGLLTELWSWTAGRQPAAGEGHPALGLTPRRPTPGLCLVRS
ncbi:hypothetical protein EYF80_037132 [Liparis tanakae]|uniref:Uncharacterized protein n=1 Tax=Liparis tanakae TaxID=230148 RepID=A0A4Z2GHL2_9TELE|nr:hypothetical protein EYF80_037132 [Liparis tanakae]